MDPIKRSAIPLAVKRTSGAGKLLHYTYLVRKFLDFTDCLGRPLTTQERRAWRFLLVEFESKPIKAALARAPASMLGPYTDLIIDLREVLQPDPVRQVRLRRNKPAAVAETHEGNYATRAALLEGVKPRRLSAAEANDKVALMVKLCSAIPVLARELALVRNRDQPEAARMVKLGKLMAKLGTDFAARSNQISPEAAADAMMAGMLTKIGRAHV